MKTRFAQTDCVAFITAASASCIVVESRIRRRMYGDGTPTPKPNGASSPFAFSPIPAELAPCRPSCPASTCITIVGFGSCFTRSITTDSFVPTRQSQFWPQ